MRLKGRLGLALMLSLLSCGPSEISQSFNRAAERQYSLDNSVLSIFQRSPVTDGLDSTVDASSNLERIPRGLVSFRKLSSQLGGLSGENLEVFYASNLLESPIFYNWAGYDVPWNSKEFKAFMLFGHISKIQDYTESLFPTLNFNSGDLDIYPLRAYSSQGGHGLDPSYDYSSEQPSVVFYQHDDESLSTLNMADEADAIYHEYAHAVQHAFNQDVLELEFSNVDSGEISDATGNPDIDAIVEGLADFYSASFLRDEAILGYLANNAPFFFLETSRRGSQHNRSLAGNLYFPKSYIFQAHLDGRVVSVALNDLRKYLRDGSLALSNCSSDCELDFLGDSISDADAWDMSTRVAYEAFGFLNETSTFYHFSTLMIGVFESTYAPLLCEDALCQTSAVDDFKRILISRGLWSSSLPIVANLFVVDNEGNPAAELEIQDALSFQPFNSTSGVSFSDTDGNLDTCEIALFYPNLVNNIDSEIYEIWYELESTVNLDEITYAETGLPVDVLLTPSEREIKFMGMIAGGADSDDYALNSSSIWYSINNGSHFTQFLGSDFFPSNLGWLAKVKDSPGDDVEIEYTVYARPTRSIDREIKSATHTQTMTITDDPKFCN